MRRTVKIFTLSVVMMDTITRWALKPFHLRLVCGKINVSYIQGEFPLDEKIRAKRKKLWWTSRNRSHLLAAKKSRVKKNNRICIAFRFARLFSPSGKEASGLTFFFTPSYFFNNLLLTAALNFILFFYLEWFSNLLQMIVSITLKTQENEFYSIEKPVTHMTI